MAELQEIVALALVFVVHVIGGLLLVWALIDDETRAGWWRRWRGGGEEPEPLPPAPPGEPVARTGPILPLPEADASSVRLRAPGRLADARPLPLRRPGHAPRPTRLPR